jgi:3-dehydroquinate dehydratase I
MMNPNYCLPIIKEQKTAVLEAIQSNLNDYRYFEVWMDYVEDTDEAFIKQLVEQLDDRLVVTFRRQNLETPLMDAVKRQRLLESFSNTPVLVDLDITRQQVELDQTKDLQLITSYHNYQETPDTLQLETIIDTMKAYQPAVYKLSTLCKTAEDALRLLQQLLELKSSGLNAIVSGMGEHGAVTRIFGTLWGNEMVFAPLTADGSSAPGQLTRQQLETIFKELGNGR